MKQALTKVKRFFRQLRGLFPEPVPTGMAQFNNWADSLVDTYWLPTADQDSIRFALASMIMHLGPSAAYKSKRYFVVTLRAAAAKQVAGAVFYEIKEKQKAAAATANPVAANGNA